MAKPLLPYQHWERRWLQGNSPTPAPNLSLAQQVSAPEQGTTSLSPRIPARRPAQTSTPYPAPRRRPRFSPQQGPQDLELPPASPPLMPARATAWRGAARHGQGPWASATICVLVAGVEGALPQAPPRPFSNHPSHGCASAVKLAGTVITTIRSR